jgi:Fe-S-cluster-containing dehydrogenase component/CRP-like cAMP-binding protein
MPKEIQSRREVLRAIEKAPPLEDLLEMHDGHYEYELDLEVCVYGRNYHGKQVGPYIKLLAWEPGETIIKQGDWGGNTFYIGVDYELDVFIKTPDGGELRVASIPQGSQFGEMSVLAGVPRAATVKAPQENGARVLEIQRPALRLLRKIPFFRDSLDAVYTKHGKMAAFQRMRIPLGVTEAMLSPQHPGLSRFQVFSKNHVLADEGSPIEELYVIKEGWLRRTTAEGRRDFLGHGYCLGLEGAAEGGVWPYTVTLLSRTELLSIPLEGLRHVPDIRDKLLGELSAFAAPEMGGGLAIPPENRTQVAASQARLITTGLVDATNLLVMDMKLCVRCGRCSMACHEIHGQSRLVRHGIAVERLVTPTSSTVQAVLAPMACMHCQDPECLTGCPTGAIGRFGDGQVDINTKTCIGCGDCAVNCPYNAISMVMRSPKPAPVPTRRQQLEELVQIRPAPLPPAVEPTEDLLAVKCNLCHGTTLNPAESKTRAYGCEENCPTGALARVSPRDYFDEITIIEGPAYPREKTSGRNIHRSDPPARKIHLAGISIVLITVLAAVFGLMRFGFNGVFGGVFTIRWVTGIVGLVGIAGTMLYPRRRRIFKRRAGPLRYWLLGHIYLGVLGAAMILLHGGTRSGGALTTVLAICFDLVILTGLWGLFCYQIVPGWLIALEPGTPLLAEDLRRRYHELETQVAEILAAASEPANKAMQTAIRRLSSWHFLLRQFTLREPLENMSADVRRDFAESRAQLADPKDRQRMDRLTDSLTSLRRLDALRYLHGTLKSWLLPHVIATSLMLALLVVHIFQVVYGIR